DCQGNRVQTAFHVNDHRLLDFKRFSIEPHYLFGVTMKLDLAWGAGIELKTKQNRIWPIPVSREPRQTLQWQYAGHRAVNRGPNKAGIIGCRRGTPSTQYFLTCRSGVAQGAAHFQDLPATHQPCLAHRVWPDFA